MISSRKGMIKREETGFLFVLLSPTVQVFHQPPIHFFFVVKLGMASASSNATSGWPRRPCACRFGPCIPTQAGPKSKYPGRYYYRCPRDKSCKWMGWCDDNSHNVPHSEDDWSLQLTNLLA